MYPECTLYASTSFLYSFLQEHRITHSHPSTGPVHSTHMKGIPGKGQKLTAQHTSFLPRTIPAGGEVSLVEYVTEEQQAQAQAECMAS